jgi:hypothetical protein
MPKVHRAGAHALLDDWMRAALGVWFLLATLYSVSA